MASKGQWTIVFDDKTVIKNYAEGAEEGYPHKIENDDTFWNDSKFSNIWAIHYGTADTSDEVEYRDDTPHTSFSEANLGNISQFSSRWDAAHLAELQENWDQDNVYDSQGNINETESEKIARIGARPTTYSS
jgi:hypothetical protein